MHSKYKAGGLETEFEPGSRRRVLRNQLGIRSAREMARAESEALLTTTERMIDETRVDQRFTSADIRRMHKLWLGDIYAWAGEYRSVNIGKGGFLFAVAKGIPQMMLDFEKGPLRDYTPCRFVQRNDQARALGVVHAELILIHPFREGNGRCARLLAMLMGLQGNLPPLDFGGIRGEAKCGYIAALHSAVERDYAPITEVFGATIERTMRRRARALL